MFNDDNFGVNRDTWGGDPGCCFFRGLSDVAKGLLGREEDLKGESKAGRLVFSTTFVQCAGTEPEVATVATSGGELTASRCIARGLRKGACRIEWAPVLVFPVHGALKAPRFHRVARIGLASG